MIRNLKTFGLALVAVLALSAVAASAASANPALFTANVGANELAEIHGEQIGVDTFKIGVLPTLTCLTAKETGFPENSDGTTRKGPEATYVELTPEFKECHIVTFGITKPVTVTHDECIYTINATKNTKVNEVLTPWLGDLTIKCPPEKAITIHVYNDNNHLETLCTYDVPGQVIAKPLHLTNEPEVNHGGGVITPDDIVAHINVDVAVHNTIKSVLCGQETNYTAVYKGTHTLRATNEAHQFVKTTIS